MTEYTAEVVLTNGVPTAQKREFSSDETFDVSGKQLSDSFSLGEVNAIELKQYDQNGRLVEITRKNLASTYLIPRKVLKYDENDRVIEEIGYSQGGTVLGKNIYKYDSFGNRIEETSESATPQSLYYNNYLTRMRYDERNRMVERSTYKRVGAQWLPEDFRVGFYKQLYLYDAVGRRIGETLIGSNEQLYRTTISEFDFVGQEIESTVFNADGTVKERTKYSYDDFDRLGNWTKQRQYWWVTSDGKSFYDAKNFTYRTIEYFSAAEVASYKKGATAPPKTDEVLRNTESDEYLVYDALLADWLGTDGPLRIVLGRFTKDRIMDEDSVDSAKPIGDVSKETSNDYGQKNRRRTYELLKDLFPHPEKIILINDSETNELFSDRTEGWKLFYVRYPNSQGMTTLSRVGFDSNKTEAVVYFGTQSDWLAGAGYQVILRKTEGIWKIASRRMLWIS
ncbi:MAG: hypothetical protein ABIP75_14505 [Pyrinomonadaceae bacterium]